MMELPVAAARADQKPAVFLDLPDGFPDFHGDSFCEIERRPELDGG
jgi:hypothetical protein